MASLLQASNCVFSASSPSSSVSYVNASISIPKIPKIRFSPSKKPVLKADHLLVVEDGLANTKYSNPLEKIVPNKNNTTSLSSTMLLMQEEMLNSADFSSATASKALLKAKLQLHAILEAVADRVEMHSNIGEQRDNWNTLLLNCINMITLTAATMAGVAAATGGSTLTLNLSSTILFSAATGMLVIMNKIQPSQLAEEQRNATKLFKQLQRQLEFVIAVKQVPSDDDVKAAMEKVLALDRAYPLPLLGKMIEKFPETFEPAAWWPSNDLKQQIRSNKMDKNGWSEELETEMREISKVIRSKDTEDYMRLGNLALKINKTLAISGSLLTGVAAIGSAFVGSHHGPLAAAIAVAAGALASAFNTLEHGGQVGMVIEMYRNCAGFFTLLEESIESTVTQSDVQKRENGEMFEMKVALHLGRSVSELRDLAKTSNSTDLEEFASKLF